MLLLLVVVDGRDERNGKRVVEMSEAERLLDE